MSTGIEYGKRCWVWLQEFGMSSGCGKGTRVGYGYSCEVWVKGLGMGQVFCMGTCMRYGYRFCLGTGMGSWFRCSKWVTMLRIS